MRISDWSSDVCSSDLSTPAAVKADKAFLTVPTETPKSSAIEVSLGNTSPAFHRPPSIASEIFRRMTSCSFRLSVSGMRENEGGLIGRSEEHTSELQSLMRISYAVFCLKKKKTKA